MTVYSVDGGFLRDGCTVMAKNIYALLALAGEQVTAENVLKVIKSLPRGPEQLLDEKWRGGECSRLVKLALDGLGEAGDADLRRDLFEYFIMDIPNRRAGAIDAIMSAFLGVLSIPYGPEIPATFGDGRVRAVGSETGTIGGASIVPEAK